METKSCRVGTHLLDSPVNVARDGSVHVSALIVSLLSSVAEEIETHPNPTTMPMATDRFMDPSTLLATSEMVLGTTG